jgi:hypothetical protein
LNLRTMAFAAMGAIAFGTTAVSFAQTAPGPQGTPPPPPVPNATSSPLISTSPQPTALPSSEQVPSSSPNPVMTPTPPAVPLASPTAEPSASPSPEGRRRSRRGEGAPTPEASPTDTPEPPQFSTLDGVWEVAMQPLSGARTIYSHLYVTQAGNTLTGTWRRGKVSLPFTGTFDGRLFKLTVANGETTELLSGYEENYMDMVGLYSDGDTKHAGTPFTAGHRKRERDRNYIQPGLPK